MGNYFNDPKLLTESLRCTCFHITPRRLDCCIQDVILSQKVKWLWVVYICKLCKTRPVFTRSELQFVLQPPGEVDLTNL